MHLDCSVQRSVLKLVACFSIRVGVLFGYFSESHISTHSAYKNH